VRWRRGAVPLRPRLRRVLLNTTWAAQVTTVQDEILGSSNGNPGQAFTTAQAPVQPGQQVLVRERERPAPADEQALAAEEGPDAVTVTRDVAGQPDEIWVRWHGVPDFHQSGPRDRHYTVDALTGEIRFGDGSAGMIPPHGQNNVRVTYRTGGGEEGNRAAGTIVELKSGVPYVDGVTNHEPAQGGAPREPIERLQARGPRVLRHRDRAVTAQDLEDLAVTASAEVARVAAIVPAFSPYNLWLDPKAPVPAPEHAATDAGRMGVIVVPNTAAARPAPSLGLLRRVQAHLQERCPPTADLWVAGPEWIAVTVAATVVPTSFEEADAVGDRARTAVERFLHPLTGGPDGQGWAFGRRPHHSDLSALLEKVRGVDHIRSLSVTLQPETADAIRRRQLQTMLERRLTETSDQPERERDLRRWLDRALVYSGRHELRVEL
jgi:predicted phage baseplate assembly protein